MIETPMKAWTKLRILRVEANETWQQLRRIFASEFSKEKKV
jgi:hypothetical protein